jgi:hypothetical protein
LFLREEEQAAMKEWESKLEGKDNAKQLQQATSANSMYGPNLLSGIKGQYGLPAASLSSWQNSIQFRTLAGIFSVACLQLHFSRQIHQFEFNLWVISCKILKLKKHFFVNEVSIMMILE